MIAWSIAAAKASGCFGRIVVSTDDEEIATVATACGAEVPFLRPAHLADDYATTQNVVIHTLQWCEQQALPVQAVCCLYATAPFVQAEDLAKAASLFERAPEHGFVFTATSFSFPIQRAFHVDAAGSARMFYPEYVNARSQDLEEAYHDAGQFYWGSPSAWSGTHNLFHDGCPLLLPRWRVQDIDSEEDWVRAELLHQILFNVSE